MHIRLLITKALILASTVANSFAVEGRQLNLSGQKDPRFIRRLYIDLTGRLPTLPERLEFSKSDFDYFDKITEMLASAEAATALSALAPGIWQYSESDLPDFERFIARGDIQLQNSLSIETRRAIVNELRLNLRETISDSKSLSQLFTAKTSFTESSAIEFWDLLSGESAGTTEFPYQRIQYNDLRPAMGIASTNGAFAVIDSHADNSARVKTKNILQKFGCQTFELPDAHQFHDLSADQIDGQLISVATTEAKCAGCHESYAGMQKMFSGVSHPSSFVNWKIFQPPTSSSGHFAGHKYDDASHFSRMFSADPRLKNCFFDRFMATIYQRKFDDSTDFETKLTMLGLLDLQSDNLQKALRLIFLHSNYSQKPLASEAASLRLRISGYRFLGPAQFDGIAKNLVGADHQIPLSDNLLPQSTNDVEKSRFVPGTKYFSAANDFVRRLAIKILVSEFSADSRATERKIFPLHPDGALSALGVENLKTAIAHVWTYLNGDAVESSSVEVNELVKLFDGVMTLEQSLSKSWEAVLVAIMLSPNFLSF